MEISYEQWASFMDEINQQRHEIHKYKKTIQDLEIRVKDLEGVTEMLHRDSKHDHKEAF